MGGYNQNMKKNCNIFKGKSLQKLFYISIEEQC